MNAHAKPIHMIPRTALLGLEGPVNDLARLAHTTAIIAERVMKDHRGLPSTAGARAARKGTPPARLYQNGC